jgi:catechol 2,3-dioxygenase-like lactoylglutathione lyase family enzyme
VIDRDCRLTHLAFQVTDIQRTIDFYTTYTRMRVVHERPGGQPGSKVVWLREQEALGSMTIVLFEKDDSGNGAARSSLNHLGFAVESRAAVDAIARRAVAEGILVLPPADHGGVVGYICEILDPDGTVIEFSHGQRL